MNTLKIEIPKGHEVESFDKTTGVIKFKETPKDIKERINSIDDIFKLNGTTEADFNKKWSGFDPYHKHHEFELLMVSAYNEGKMPNFTDGTDKYYPIFNMGSPSGVGFSYGGCDGWFSLSTVGARQVYCGPNAKANMLDAVKKFLPQYKDSRTI